MEPILAYIDFDTSRVELAGAMMKVPDRVTMDPEFEFHGITHMNALDDLAQSISERNLEPSSCAGVAFVYVESFGFSHLDPARLKLGVVVHRLQDMGLSVVLNSYDIDAWKLRIARDLGVPIFETNTLLYTSQTDESSFMPKFLRIAEAVYRQASGGIEKPNSLER